MSTKKIAVLAGDGIGKEVIPQALSAVRAVGAGVEFTEFDWGVDRYLRDGVTVPVDGFSLLAGGFDAVLVGAFGDSRVKSNIHAREILLGLRFQLDLYANVRPVKLLDRLLCPLKDCAPEDVNFTIIRENTEGIYGDVGGVFKRGTADKIAVQEDVNTRKGDREPHMIRFPFSVAGFPSTDKL